MFTINEHPIIMYKEYKMIDNFKDNIFKLAIDEFKKYGIQFMDTAGNIYLNQYPIYIFIKGNKPKDIFLKMTAPRAFEPSGLKIIFALICYPDLIKKTYRYIAELTNVALGTVGWVINELINLGYVIEMGERGRELL